MSREYVRIDHTSQAQESPIESCMKEPGLGRGSPTRRGAAAEFHASTDGAAASTAPCVVAAAGPRLERRLNSPESLDPCKL